MHGVLTGGCHALMLQLSDLTYLLEIDMGTLRDLYEIYVSCCETVGQTPVSFDEWLNA